MVSSSCCGNLLISGEFNIQLGVDGMHAILELVTFELNIHVYRRAEDGIGHSKSRRRRRRRQLYLKSNKMVNITLANSLLHRLHIHTPPCGTTKHILTL